MSIYKQAGLSCKLGTTKAPKLTPVAHQILGGAIIMR